MQISRSELEQHMTIEKVKPVQLISLILYLSAVLFTGIIIVLYVKRDLNGGGIPVEESLVGVFRYLALAATLLGGVLAQFLPGFLYSPQRIATRIGDTSSDDVGTASEKYITYVQSWFILRLAPLEGAAYFGAIGILPAAFKSVNLSIADFVMLLLPLGYFTVKVYLDFPSKSRQLDLLESWLVKS